MLCSYCAGSGQVDIPCSCIGMSSQYGCKRCGNTGIADTILCEACEGTGEATIILDYEEEEE